MTRGYLLLLETVTTARVQVESFVEALSEARYLVSAGIEKINACTATDEQLKKLRAAARHTLIQASKAFSDK